MLDFPTKSSFNIVFSEKVSFFKKGEILTTGYSELLILKVYKYTWFRKLIYFLFKTSFKRKNTIKVKIIHYDTRKIKR